MLFGIDCGTRLNVLPSSGNIPAHIIEFYEEGEVAASIVRNWMDENHGRFAADASNGVDWRANANGAALLQALFSELSSNRVNYDKVKHGMELTRWIIDNSPEDFASIRETINSLIS